MIVVVMGVAGVGKSLIGAKLAEQLGLPFLEGDAYHPAENVAKMRGGVPLDDVDRWPWLEALGRDAARRGACVVACSALKESYRKRLRRHAPRAVFVHLRGRPEVIAKRLAARTGHYMPPTLLDSQIATLETPRNAIVVDIDAAPETVLARIRAALRKRRMISGAAARS